MKQRWKPLLIALVWLGAIFATPAVAEIDGDIRAGYYIDTEEPMIGGGILTGLGEGWYFNPNAEIVFVDGGDLITLNGDFHYDFSLGSDASWWLGAGPAILFADADGGDDDTDLGVNLLIGVTALHGKVRPFAQGKVIISDDTEGVISVGIRF